MRSVASGVADIQVVDRAVDGAGGIAYGTGGILSLFQSGRIRNYLFGAVAVTALFAVIALCIRMTSRGPAYFRQMRVGFRGQLFALFKFHGDFNFVGKACGH